MKVRLSKKVIAKVKECYEEDVRRTNEVSCVDVYCFRIKRISCDFCNIYNDGLLHIEYDKVKVD